MTLGKKFWWLTASLIVALLVAGFIYRLLSEPVYQGRHFSSWFHEAEQMPYVYEPGPYTQAITAMGPDAVPLLAALVRRPDPWWVSPYWHRYPRWPAKIRRWLPMPRYPGSRQNNAAMLLYHLGPAGRPAVPDLIVAYDAAYRKFYHLSRGFKLDWKAQFSHPPPALPPNTPEDSLRFWLLQAVLHCGDNNAETIPLLFSATHDSNRGLREFALSSLRSSTNLDGAIRLSKDIVLTALADPDPAVRAAAAAVLGRIAAGQPDLIAALLKTAEDSDVAVRHEALEALKKIKPDLQIALPVLGRVITDSKGIETATAVQVLSKSVGVTNVISVLTGYLENVDPQVRVGAAQALSFYRGNAQMAVPKLQKLTNAAIEPDESVRRAAAEALKRIAPKKTVP